MKAYQTVLSEQLTERKLKNPQYSLRSFAKHLEMSPALLSSLISGKKSLSLKQASKIIHKLDLDEQASADFLKEMLPGSMTQTFLNPETQVLSEDEFKVISHWAHFAILSLGHLKKNEATPKWISQKLGIEYFFAQECFQRLQHLGLIEVEKGQFRQTGKPLVTTQEIPSAVIRGYHKQCLHLAEEKLETVKIEKRNFSSITMAVNPAKLEKAKKMINEFRNKLCKELEDDKVCEVYTFSMQLFPLTKMDD